MKSSTKNMLLGLGVAVGAGLIVNKLTSPAGASGLPQWSQSSFGSNPQPYGNSQLVSGGFPLVSKRITMRDAKAASKGTLV